MIVPFNSYVSLFVSFPFISYVSISISSRACFYWQQMQLFLLICMSLSLSLFPLFLMFLSLSHQGRVSTDDNDCDSFRWKHLQRVHSFMNFIILRGSEQIDKASPWMKQACAASVTRSEALRSEWAVRAVLVDGCSKCPSGPWTHRSQSQNPRWKEKCG